MSPPDRQRQTGQDRRHLSGSILSVGASRSASLVAIALTSVVITRLLGPAGIGAYAISAALLFVFTVAFELGLPQALAYYAGRDEWSGQPLVRGAIGACFALSVPGAAAMLGSYALFGDSAPGITWPMAIALALALPFSLLWRIGPQAALAQERFEIFALLDSSPALLACPISIAAAALTGTEGAVIGFAASMILSGTSIAAWLMMRSGDAHRASPPGGLRAVLAYGTRAWASEVLTQVNLRVDLILVGAYAGAAEAGIYSVALSTTSVAWVLTAAFAISALPRSARMHAEHGRAALGAADRDASDARTIRHTVLVIPVVAVAELLLLGVGIPLFYGSGFDRSIGLGLILLPGSLLLGVGMAAVAILLGRGQTGRVLRVGIAVVPATIAAYAFAIPATDGSIGAAIVSSASYTAYAALSLLALRRASGLEIRELLQPQRDDVEDYRSLARRGFARLGGSTVSPR